MPSCWDGDASSQQLGAGPRLKTFIIFLLSIMGLSFTMILDCPEALRDDLIKEMNLSRNQFALQYHLLYWPNIFCWLAGFLVDRFLSIETASVIFLTIAMFGNTLYAIGGVTQVYQVMLFGRVITGIGIEASYIFISCYVIRWFPKKITNTVFALTKSLPLLGNTFVINISDIVTQKTSLSMMKRHSLSIGISVVMSVIVVPLVCSIILALISKSRRTRGNISSEQQTIKLKDIIQFPLPFWFLSITVNLFLSSCLIFLRVNALNFKYGLNEKQTEVLIRTFNISSAIMAPILGLTVDWKGRNLTGITLAIIGGLTAHFSFAFILSYPFYPMILLSFSYSVMVGSYWSLYNYLFTLRVINTAFAIDHTFLMLFCAIGNTLAPLLVKRVSYAVEILYLVFTFIALIGCCILWGLECWMKTLNNNTSHLKKRQRYQTEKNGMKTPSERKISKGKKKSDSRRRVSRPEIRGYEITLLKHKRSEGHTNSSRKKRNELKEKKSFKSSEELQRL